MLIPGSEAEKDFVQKLLKKHREKVQQDNPEKKMPDESDISKKK
jgi:hypothetical protein